MKRHQPHQPMLPCNHVLFYVHKTYLLFYRHILHYALLFYFVHRKKMTGRRRKKGSKKEKWIQAARLTWTRHNILCDKLAKEKTWERVFKTLFSCVCSWFAADARLVVILIAKKNNKEIKWKKWKPFSLLCIYRMD